MTLTSINAFGNHGLSISRLSIIGLIIIGIITNILSINILGINITVLTPLVAHLLVVHQPDVLLQAGVQQIHVVGLRLDGVGEEAEGLVRLQAVHGDLKEPSILV